MDTGLRRGFYVAGGTAAVAGAAAGGLAVAGAAGITSVGSMTVGEIAAGASASVTNASIWVYSHGTALVYTAGAPTAVSSGMVVAAEKAEFSSFAARARAAGLTANPNRLGSWGKIINGKFKEIARIDVAEIGKAGWRGKTHIHIDGIRGHLPPNTPIPGQ